MMRHLNIKMNVTCNSADVLAKLRENRDLHSQMVEEANVGFRVAVREWLTAQLAALDAASTVDLRFPHTKPQDMRSVYDTAIQMLELHTEDEITLSATEVRQLVQDEWDWSDSFLLSNIHHSATAAAMAERKGLV